MYPRLSTYVLVDVPTSRVFSLVTGPELWGTNLGRTKALTTRALKRPTSSVGGEDFYLKTIEGVPCRPQDTSVPVQVQGRSTRGRQGPGPDHRRVWSLGLPGSRGETGGLTPYVTWGGRVSVPTGPRDLDEKGSRPRTPCGPPVPGKDFRRGGPYGAYDSAKGDVSPSPPLGCGCTYPEPRKGTPPELRSDRSPWGSRTDEEETPTVTFDSCTHPLAKGLCLGPRCETLIQSL